MFAHKTCYLVTHWRIVGVAGYLQTYSARQILHISTGVLISP